jgi:hypothetical protein
MDHTQLLKSANLPATKEYGMHDGKIEARILGAGSAQERECTNVSSEPGLAKNNQKWTDRGTIKCIPAFRLARFTDSCLEDAR